MKTLQWYLAKIIFRIITKDDDDLGLFEEKLRLINGENMQEALQNAAVWGKRMLLSLSMIPDKRLFGNLLLFQN